MRDKVAVSIIMPFLNQERFIREAIGSVFIQTFEDWELLLIDDGSTDRSSEIALYYAKQNAKRIHYFEHEDHQNRGASAARNLGLRNAQGKYIAFLDADDVWLPHKLAQQVMILESHPEAALVFGTTQWWYSWTGNPEDIEKDYIRELGLKPGIAYPPPTLFAPFFLKRIIPSPCTCSVLVRREISDRIGGFEESFRHIYTDQAFYAKLCLVASVFALGDCSARYRQHPDSSCAVVKRSGQKQAARYFFVSWLATYLRTQGIRDREVWRSVREELWRYKHPSLYHLFNRARQSISRGQIRLFRQGYQELK